MKLKLQISIGDSYDSTKHVIILPNNDSHPHLIENKYFKGRICVRIKDFKGITPLGTTIIESSPYFEGNSDRYSIQVQGRFKENNIVQDKEGSFKKVNNENGNNEEKIEEEKKTLTADDIIFGNDFDQKINLPLGSSIGLKILQYIDPGLKADIYSDKPWAYSPLTYTMNKINLQEFDNVKDDDELPLWPSPNGEHIEENIILQNYNIIDDVSKRKKYFENEKNRKNFQIKNNQIWNFDFFNSYVDFNDVAISLPGFKLGILQYWDGQPIRYVCKIRDSSIVFFVIVFQLIHIEEEENDDTIETSKDKESEESSLEKQPVISDLTPKTGARWASVKSPSSFFPFNNSKETSLSPSSTLSSPSISNDMAKLNVDDDDTSILD